jgi:hypothetical protein
MKTVVTLSRVYKKEVKIEIDPKKLKSMGVEEIHDYIDKVFETETPEQDELFDKAELEEIGGEDIDSDRFDITDESGNVIYGGHLY